VILIIQQSIKKENNIIINTNIGKYCLNIWEITEDKSELKKQINMKSDGVIYMFDTTNKTSLNNINKWIKKVNTYNNNKYIPSMLIGNKIEMVKNKNSLYKDIIQLKK
jgi:GTPase SAR1 family protein